MKWIAAALFAAMLALLPSFAGDFYINLASQIVIAAIFFVYLVFLLVFGFIFNLLEPVLQPLVGRIFKH